MVCHSSEILEDIDYLWTIMMQNNNTTFTWDGNVKAREDVREDRMKR